MNLNLINLAESLLQLPHPKPADLVRLQRQYTKTDGYFTKIEIMEAISYLNRSLNTPLKKLLLVRPIRTASGVTPVTVLTKPYPCPGECIFCPSDIRMPKSYLSMEPGAQRAATNRFDPYLQVYNRLLAFQSMGHSFSKVELLVLGGTWSVYPLAYRLWFLKRLFDALTDFGIGRDQRQLAQNQLTLTLPTQSKFEGNYNLAVKRVYPMKLNSQHQTATWHDLETTHQKNQSAPVRCVGLVLETRPDYVTKAEVLALRRMGATKIQIGIQTLNSQILRQNKRGHTVSASKKALSLLRTAGFKIHVHWMPNLLGATVKKDIADYRRVFADTAIRPDEIKIYPTSLIAGTELVKHYENGSWKPYSTQELNQVLSFCLTHTPRYCRISRMIRDIPSNDIVVGNKTTNFREIAALTDPQHQQDIRAREIRTQSVNAAGLKLKITSYLTIHSREYFLEWITPEDKIAGFLRLSLPRVDYLINRLTAELNHSAIIREVHIYGQVLDIGNTDQTKTQHQGLGKALIQKAINLAKLHHFQKVAVISAVGTRNYYEGLGFYPGKLYHHYEL